MAKSDEETGTVSAVQVAPSSVVLAMRPRSPTANTDTGVRSRPDGYSDISPNACVPRCTAMSFLAGTPARISDGGWR